MSDFLNEYGLSSEPIDQFVARNRFPAEQRLKYPQNLSTGQEVNRCGDIPFLPIDDWLDTEDWSKMLEEAQRLSKHYVPHRNHENHQGWSSLCIHGLSSVHTESSHTYGFTDAEAPWRWTDVSDWCPTITEFFKTKFNYTKYFRIRIMKLAPGGYIVPHRDSIRLEENHIGPVNLALNNPEGAEFYMDGHGYLPWVQGRAIKLNLYNVHSVFNHSNEDRYHVIVHGHMGLTWHNKLLTNYNKWKEIYA